MSVLSTSLDHRSQMLLTGRQTERPRVQVEDDFEVFDERSSDHGTAVHEIYGGKSQKEP